MENNDINEQTDISLILNSNDIKSHLLEASKWGKFLSILGFIGIGLMVLLSLVMVVGLSFASNLSGATGFPSAAFGVLYLFIALIYFFPVFYLYKFSTQTRQAILSNNTFSLTSGFSSLKSLFKFMGILAIVMLSLYVLVIIFGVSAAMMAGF